MGRARGGRPRSADRGLGSGLEAANDLWQRLARDLGLGQRRIPIVVCPTSWTVDEDFDLLLEALERAERALTPGWERHRTARRIWPC